MDTFVVLWTQSFSYEHNCFLMKSTLFLNQTIVFLWKPHEINCFLKNTLCFQDNHRNTLLFLWTDIFVWAKQMFEYINNSVVGDTGFVCKTGTHNYILIIHADMIWLYTIKQLLWATHVFLFTDISQINIYVCRVLHNYI